MVTATNWVRTSRQGIRPSSQHGLNPQSQKSLSCGMNSTHHTHSEDSVFLANISTHSLMQSLSDIFADDEENTLEIFTASLRRGDAMDNEMSHKNILSWQGSCHSFFGNGEGDDLLNSSISHASFNDSFDKKKTYVNHVANAAARHHVTSGCKPLMDNEGLKTRHTKMAMYADLNKNLSSNTSPNKTTSSSPPSRKVIPRFVLQKGDSRLGESTLTVDSAKTIFSCSQLSSNSNNNNSSGCSRVISSSTESPGESSESNDCAPRKPIRGDITKAITLLNGSAHGTDKLGENSSHSGNSSIHSKASGQSQQEITVVSPVMGRGRNNQRLGINDVLRNSSHHNDFSLVSPASSTTSEASSQSEAVVKIAPSLRHRQLEMMDSCPLVSGNDIRRGDGGMLIRSDSTLSDAAPKRPSRSRSPTGLSAPPLSSSSHQRTKASSKRDQRSAQLADHQRRLVSEFQKATSCHALNATNGCGGGGGVPPLGPSRRGLPPPLSSPMKSSASCRALVSSPSKSSNCASAKDLTPVLPRRNRGSALQTASSCRQLGDTRNATRPEQYRSSPRAYTNERMRYPATSPSTTTTAGSNKCGGGGDESQQLASRLEHAIALSRSVRAEL